MRRVGVGVVVVVDMLICMCVCVGVCPSVRTLLQVASETTANQTRQSRSLARSLARRNLGIVRKKTASTGREEYCPGLWLPTRPLEDTVPGLGSSPKCLSVWGQPPFALYMGRHWRPWSRSMGRSESEVKLSWARHTTPALGSFASTFVVDQSATVARHDGGQSCRQPGLGPLFFLLACLSTRGRWSVLHQSVRCVMQGLLGRQDSMPQSQARSKALGSDSGDGALHGVHCSTAQMDIQKRAGAD